MLDVNGIRKVFYPGTVNEKLVLDDLSIHFADGDFVTIIGSNGAGKSTLLNCIAGVYPIDAGDILIDNASVVKLSEYKRAGFLGRVFQDPMMGTAADMNIEENLALAYRRGKKRTLKWSITEKERTEYRRELARLDLGLEDRLTAKVGLLSGGQRQALTLMMATLNTPKLLLLDEHTAALDPKTAAKVLEITNEIVNEKHLTAMMVTHNMNDAIRMGNRLIMMDSGKIVVDVHGDEKKSLKKADLLQMFERAAGKELAGDRTLLG